MDGMDTQKTAYFPVALNLQGARVVVVGADAEAGDKAGKLAEAGAEVLVLWPTADPRVRALAESGAITYEARPPDAADFHGVRVVLSTPPDPDLARWLRERGRVEGFWLCALDQPAYCDWVNMGQVRAGPVRVAIGSGGGAPGLVRRLRQDLEKALDGRFAAFAQRLVAFREHLRDRPAEERRHRLALALEGFRLEIRVHYPPWEGAPEGEPPK